MGTGNIAKKFADAIDFVPQANLYAVASRTQEKADNFTSQFKKTKAYGSYDDLVKDENTDVIYIATPMSEHYQNTMLCFSHNKNVICEKTVCVNSVELKSLIETAKSKNLFFMEAMWMKCLPAFKKALEWKSQIGDIKVIKADFSFFAEYNPDSRLFNKDLGGGACLDLLVYPLSLITAFCGFDFSNIKSSVYRKNDVDIDETVILEYPNRYAVASAGFCNNSACTATVIGENGRIEFGSGFWYTENVKLYLADGKLSEEFHKPHRKNGYEYEVEEVVSCLLNKQTESKIIPMIDTLRVLEIMDSAIY
jgi:predicted dehydrogenase